MGVSRELIPLSDGAGEVEAIGKEVTGLKNGDRVTGLYFPLWQSGEIDARKFAVARGGEPTDGVLTGFDAKINPLPIMRKSLSVNGIYVGSRAMQEQFQSALAVNRIHPVIDRVFEMQQARKAYEHLRSGRHFGKIVIRLD
jgi:NADPH:quinone reductase-like Zn-dependent oxidoreductase